MSVVSACPVRGRMASMAAMMCRSASPSGVGGGGVDIMGVGGVLACCGGPLLSLAASPWRGGSPPGMPALPPSGWPSPLCMSSVWSASSWAGACLVVVVVVVVTVGTVVVRWWLLASAVRVVYVVVVALGSCPPWGESEGFVGGSCSPAVCVGGCVCSTVTTEGWTLVPGGGTSGVIRA